MFSGEGTRLLLIKTLFVHTAENLINKDQSCWIEIHRLKVRKFVDDAEQFTGNSSHILHDEFTVLLFMKLKKLWDSWECKNYGCEALRIGINFIIFLFILLKTTHGEVTCLNIVLIKILNIHEISLTIQRKNLEKKFMKEIFLLIS